MQPPFRRVRKAAFLGDRDEVAQMAQFHSHHTSQVWHTTYKVFFLLASTI
jgi:hypothetical protein